MRGGIVFLLALLLLCPMLTSCGSGDGSNAETPRTTALTVRDEAHVVASQGDVFEVDSAGRLVSVIRVQSWNPVVTYAEGVDYRVDLPNSSIEIIAGGTVVPDTKLYIDYTVETTL